VSEMSYIVFFALFIGAIGLRLRRELSFVRIGSLRFQLRLYILPIVALLVSYVVGMKSPSLLIMTWLLSIVLVVYSLKTTAFENRTDGVWFRKNPWVSTGVLMLFVGRLVYRSVVLMRMSDAAVQSPQEVAEFWGQSPLSLMTLLLLTSYNGLYYLGVKKRATQIKA
jgi:hypothetical protein